MAKLLTKIPFLSRFGKAWKGLTDLKVFQQRTLPLKAAFGLFALGMALMFNEAYRDHAAAGEGAAGEDFIHMVPLGGKAIGTVLAALAFFVSIWMRQRQTATTRHRLIIISLWIASIGALCAWLPGDVIATQSAIAGKAPAGENPSLPAYFGKLMLVGFLILSPPITAWFFFRLELMDQYVVKNFLTPFFFCMIAFVSIWLISDLTDNASAFSGSPGRMVRFYVVQIPFITLFVFPIAILLGLLYSMSRMSKSNELISMIGAGRSVMRILAPLFFIGVYSSLIALALKWEWAPRSAGTAEAIFKQAATERIARAKNLTMPSRKSLFAKTGWMHVNEYASRSWFVGMVPLDLSDPMGNVFIWERDANGQPTQMWQARRASWDWQADPPDWTLFEGKKYRYGEDRVPRIESFDELKLLGWNETPWKVLSSSQNPEFLGMPGLTMYLNANREMSDKDLAAFRTNRWNILSEPATCLGMVLVAAPLGIVYSRKGVLGGVTAAVAVFALMYIIKGTSMALGQGNRISPFVGAWACNLFVIGIGIFLLWFRSRNREMPKLGKALLGAFTLGRR